MTQLREFLRHQYIGAIVIGLLAYQGLAQIITASISPIVVFMGNFGDRTLSSDKPVVTWMQLMPNLVYAVLSLTLSFLLLRWLYMSLPKVSLEEPIDEAAE
jgi:hypothetical protein